MQNFNSELFEVLQSKLKTGNRRGVHLNAIPGNSRYKFDLHRLSNVFKSLPERFVLNLLTQRNINFKFSITDKEYTENKSTTNEITTFENNSELNLADVIELEDENLKKIVESIENLMFQNDVILSEKGINTLGFGFPILIRRDIKDGQITAAPILIWTITLKQVNELNTWEITRNEDDAIYVNEVLINHLQSDCGILIDKIPEEMLEDGKINKPELLDICTKILEKLKIDQNIDFILDNYAEISAIKPKAFYEEVLAKKGDGILLKSGIFSLFEVQKQNIINDYQALKESFTPLEQTAKPEFQSLSSVETDPSQQKILEALKTESKIVIQGPPGTGKSQTLTAILINALENKQKSIVVCEKQTALEVLHQALQNNGLGKFCALIKSTNSDRKTIVNAVRENIDNPNFSIKNENLAAESLKNLTARLTNSLNKINASHHILNSNIISNKNWTQVIGDLLTYQNTKTDIDLDNLQLKFTDQEFNDILYIIEKGEHFYQEFKPFKLQTFIDWNLLVAEDYFSAQNKIDVSIEKYKSTWNQISNEILDYKAFFYQTRKFEFIESIEKVEKIINEIELITSTLTNESDLFNQKKTNRFWYKILSILSAEKKQILEKQKKIQLLSFEIKQISQRRYFSEINISADLEKNVQAIKNYKQILESLKSSFEKNVEAEFDALDYLNLYDKSIFNEQSEKISAKIKVLLSEIKKDAIIESKSSLNFLELKNFINQIFSAFNNYKTANVNPFLAEYNWFKFFINLNAFQKLIVNRLYSNKNWEASLLHSYYSKLLQSKPKQDLLTDTFDYFEFLNSMNHFKIVQTEYIQSYWISEQQQAVKRFETTNKQLTVANLYNKRSSENHKKLTLRQIVEKDIDLFTTFFPIILITPDSCSNLFLGKNFYFDHVIFDEASQLKIEDNLPAMLKGKKIIIAGDEHQMPPSNYFSKVFDGNIDDEDEIETENLEPISTNPILNLESLLDYAVEFNFNKNYLDFHYRSKHPYLIDFSNAAFYQSRLKPLPAKTTEKPIEFYQINGIFESHINVEEAEKIIEILNQIKPLENGTYPSVGIATFNITQRNYIKRLINKISNNPENEEFRNKILALESAGLFIKNLENIQGDERDIIIISTTYGRKKTGKFTQSFGPINHTKGYKLLNVIITRAKEKIIICNSIPEEYFLNYKDALVQEKANNRKAILYAYLAYCKAISDTNDEERKEIVSQLISKNIGNNTAENDTIFLNEIYWALKIQFPDVKLTKNFMFGGYTIDILLEREGQPKIAIECLSKSVYSNNLAYKEDLHKEKMLTTNGYKYYRIWSHNCWQNLNYELKKIL